MTFYIKRIVLMVVSVALLAVTPGCTISKKECLQGDWQTKGYEDGQAGKSPDVINRYADKCAKHGVTPDPSAYSAGFDVGIALYCTAENGLDEGVGNNSYSGACPADLEPAFLKSYVAGLRSALDDLEIEYDRDSLDLDRLRSNRDRLAAKGAPHATDDKRIEAKSSALQSNTTTRSAISRKIREWSGKL